MARALIGSLALVVLLAGCTSSGAKQGAGASSGRPTTATATGGSTSPASGTPSSTPSGNPPRARVAPRLSGFRITDLTWVGAQGWALGSAQCLSGTGRCDAIEHTTDGGRTWASLPAPAAGPGDSPTACARLCVAGLRFATTSIGYAFAGPGLGGGAAFFRTQDGGRTWHRRSGGAGALESLNGNVVRVVTTTPGCPPGCHYAVQTAAVQTAAVQTAAVAGTRWRTVSLPGRAGQGDGATLGRAGHHVYLDTFSNPAGGAERAYSVLYTSADDGAHWTNRGEPCPQRGGENDSRFLSVAPTGAAAIVCLIRGATATPSLITSADGGRSWRRPSGTSLGSAGAYAVGAATGATVVVSSGDATYRTTDAGARFQRVGAPAQLRSIAFESSTVGHAVANDRRSVWTTSDGGRTWSRHRFGSSGNPRRRHLALAALECQLSPRRPRDPAHPGEVDPRDGNRPTTYDPPESSGTPEKGRSTVTATKVSIKPLEDRIVVQANEAETTTASGIVIPDTAKEKPQEGTVLAVGPGRIDDKGNRVPLDVTVGDVVLYSKYGGTEVKYAGEEYLVLSARDVLAVIEK